MIAENKTTPPVCPHCGADLVAVENAELCKPPRVVCSRVLEHYPLALDLTKKQRDALPVTEQGGLPPAKPDRLAREWSKWEKKHFPFAHVPYVKPLTLSAVLAPCEAVHRKWEKANAKKWIKGRDNGVRHAFWLGGPVGRLLPSEVLEQFYPLNLLYSEYREMLIGCHLEPRSFEDWKETYLAVQQQQSA